MSNQRLLTLAQLAERWGWSRDRIYRLIYSKEIPHVRIGGRILFEEATIDEWLASKRVAPKDFTPAPEPRRGALTREEECARLGIPVDHEFS